MDSFEYISIEEAVGVLRVEHEDLRPLEAVSALFGAPAFYDPHADWVLILQDLEPGRVIVDRMAGHQLSQVHEIVNELGEDANLPSRHPEADNKKSLDLLKEVAAVHLESLTRRHGDIHAEAGTSAPDDELAAHSDTWLLHQMDYLRQRLSLLASIRAVNIQNRLDARNNRHGSKREVAGALGIKPQTIQDVLHAFRTRFNVLD